MYIYIYIYVYIYIYKCTSSSSNSLTMRILDEIAYLIFDTSDAYIRIQICISIYIHSDMHIDIHT